MFKRLAFTAAIVLAQITVANACPTGLRKFETVDGVAKNLGGKPTCILEGTIVGRKALELDSAFSYFVLGKVFVGQERRVVDASKNHPIEMNPDTGKPFEILPGKLVINPGVQIYGLNASKDFTGIFDGIANAKGVLISELADNNLQSFISVTRQSTIEIKGKPNGVVLMTSAQGQWPNPKANLADQAPGDWGGLVLNGHARTSQCKKAFKGCNIPGEANVGWYGGDNDRHNAGIIQYLQIEYGGDKIDGEKELNGLTLNAIGIDTTLENIAILHNNDDCIEFFGGAAIVKNLFCYKQTDDGIDSTDGARFYIQNGVAVAQDFNTANGDNDRFIIEADSNKDAAQVAALRSHGVLHNFTFIGAKNSQGFRFRRGTNYKVENSIMFGFDLKCWAPHADPFNAVELNSNSFSGCTAADQPELAKLGLNEYLQVNAFDTNEDRPWELNTPVPGAKMYRPGLGGNFQFLGKPKNAQEAYVVNKFKRAYQRVPVKGSYGGFEWVEVVELD